VKVCAQETIRQSLLKERELKVWGAPRVGVGHRADALLERRLDVLYAAANWTLSLPHTHTHTHTLSLSAYTHSLLLSLSHTLSRVWGAPRVGVGHRADAFLERQQRLVDFRTCLRVPS